MKKLICILLLLLANSAQAQNAGLNEAVDLWMGNDTSNNCYVDSAPQQPGGYTAYCNGGYFPGQQQGPANYRHVPELPRIQLKDALANPTRQKTAPLPEPIKAPAFSENWQDRQGGVVRGNKVNNIGPDKGAPRLVLERVVFNGAKAIRVFEAHNYPVCDPGTSTCMVLIRQLQNSSWSYSDTGDFHAPAVAGRFNDAFITDSKVIDVLWDSPNYTVFIAGLSNTFLFKRNGRQVDVGDGRSIENR